MARVAAVVLALGLAGAAAGADGISVRIDAGPDESIARIIEERLNLPLIPVSEQADTGTWNEAVMKETGRLTRLLHDMGHRTGRVEVDAGEGEHLVFRVEAGPMYRVGWVDVEGLPEDVAPALRAAAADALASVAGTPASATTVETASGSVLWVLRQNGFARAEREAVDLALEPDTLTAGVIVSVRPGDPVRLGKVEFSGSVRHGADELQPLVTIEPGQAYSDSAMEDLSESLSATGYFRRARVTLADAPGPDGLTPVLVDLRDGPQDPEMLKETGRIGLAMVLVAIGGLVGREALRTSPLWRRNAIRWPANVLAVALAGVGIYAAVARILDFIA